MNCQPDFQTMLMVYGAILAGCVIAYIIVKALREVQERHEHERGQRQTSSFDQRRMPAGFRRAR